MRAEELVEVVVGDYVAELVVNAHQQNGALGSVVFGTHLCVEVNKNNKLIDYRLQYCLFTLYC